jgi:hypothetical protein
VTASRAAGESSALPKAKRMSELSVTTVLDPSVLSCSRSVTESETSMSVTSSSRSVTESAISAAVGSPASSGSGAGVAAADTSPAVTTPSTAATRRGLTARP